MEFDFLIVIGTGVAIVGLCYNFLRNFKKDLNIRLDKIDTDVKNMDGDIKALTSRLDSHASRIDQLYRMFVDLLQKK